MSSSGKAPELRAGLGEEWQDTALTSDLLTLKSFMAPYFPEQGQQEAPLTTEGQLQIGPLPDLLEVRNKSNKHQLPMGHSLGPACQPTAAQ